MPSSIHSLVQGHLSSHKPHTKSAGTAPSPKCGPCYPGSSSACLAQPGSAPRPPAHCACTRTRGLSCQPWFRFTSPIPHPSPPCLLPLSLVQQPSLVPLTPRLHILLQPPAAQGHRNEGRAPVFYGASVLDALCPKAPQSLHFTCGGKGSVQFIHSNASEPAKHTNGRPSSWSGTWDEDRGHPIWLVRCQYSEDLWMLTPHPVEGRKGEEGLEVSG